MKFSKTLLKKMKTQAWLSFILKSKDAKAISELDQLIFNVSTNISISRTNLNNEKLAINWDKYRNQDASPNKSILKKINQKKYVPGSMDIFELGLFDGEKIVPIWQIFELAHNSRSHESENLWMMVDSICNEIRSLSRFGADYSLRIEKIGQLLVPDVAWKTLNFSNPVNHPPINAVVKAYRDHHFVPTLQLLGGTMAMWRIAIDIGENMAQMEYLVRGLLTEPFVEILSSHNIYNEFLVAFNHIEINHCRHPVKLESAKKILETLTYKH